MNPLAYVIFNFVLASTFLALQILHFSDFLVGNGIYYFFYLTNWAICFETATVLCLFVSVLWGYTLLPTADKALPTPLFVRITVAMWYCAQPISLVVVLLYWTIVNPIWDVEPVIFSSLWAHFLDWIALLISLFACRIPFSFKNGIWSLMFLLTYLAWTIIHFVARIGTRTPCDDYPQELCPLYSQFDWNQPQGAIIITLAALVGLLLVVLLYVGFVKCRDACDQKHTVLSDLEEGKPTAKE